MTQTDAQTLKEEGNKLFKEGSYLKAAAAYTRALKASPDNAVLYSNRSAALLKLNKLQKALADAEEATKLDPDFHKGWMRKGMVLESQGQHQEALDCFQKANAVVGGGNADYVARIKALRGKTSKQQSAAKTAKPAAELSALQYAESKLAYVRELILESGGSSSNSSVFPPELHLLYPRGGDSSSKSSRQPDGDDEDKNSELSTTHPGMKELCIRAQHAFDAPDTVTMFLGEMRQQALDLQATAAVLVAPKSAVSFPQTWRQSSWQFGQHDGVFVQLQALVPASPATCDVGDDTSDKGPRGSSDGSGGSSSSKGGGNGSSTSRRNTVLQKVYFIRIRPDKPPSEPVELGEEFALLLPLLK